MKFHRTLLPFKVMSFDLDDTLYDNSEVIRLAELNCVDFLRNSSHINQLDLDYWHSWKHQIEGNDPILCEDVTAWRMATIQAMLQFHGKNTIEIEEICRDAMDYFLHWRHKIDVPQQSLEVLNVLQSKYKLAALTNGNVVPERIGFSQFALTLWGGKNGRAKPHCDLFHQTAKYFRVEPHEILHIGDNLTTDVQGAIQAGCQAVWLNLSEKTFAQFEEARVLPTVEISELSDLLKLNSGGESLHI
jgi:HAD hydrolase, family IA, variant 1